MNWITSGGGPLLLLPCGLLKFWDGIQEPQDGREVIAKFRWNQGGPATDYDRACDVEDYVGIVEVGPGYGIVLGDEPMMTTWYSGPDQRNDMLVRWMWAENEEEVSKYLVSLPENLAWEIEGEIHFENGSLVLFDSAEPGLELLGEYLEIELSRGTFTIETCLYNPDPKTSLVLHRLTAVTLASC